jgi:hypothetical protein
MNHVQTGLKDQINEESAKIMAHKKYAVEETLELQVPLEVEGGQILHKLTIRRPKVKDLQLAELKAHDDFSKTIELISSLTMLTPAQVSEMDGSDYMRFRDKIQSFLGLGQ